MIDEFLKEALQKREEDGLLRKLVLPSNGIDFCSNDYLGLAKNFESMHSENNGGSTGSRLISGNSKQAEEFEQFLSKFHKAEAALVFNTGYMANVGLFSSIGDKATTFIYDEHIHASIIDGMRLSLAKRYKFKHNDLTDLGKKLSLGSERKIVVVESLYSMDGDIAPLKEITSICKSNNADLIVDEAHATGIFGENGEGLVCALELENEVWARVHTFGKALGIHGAAVVGTNILKSFLVNYSRSFIYTTALPSSVYVQIKHSYENLNDLSRKRLFELIVYFTTKATELLNGKFEIFLNHSPIQGILIPGNQRAKEVAEYLQEKGFFVKAILSPTVAKGTERIRICLHSFNTKEEIDDLLRTIKLIES